MSMKKPKRIIVGYKMKHQQSGGFKVVEYSRMDNESYVRKRVLKKNMTMTDADDYIYRLESKHIK